MSTTPESEYRVCFLSGNLFNERKKETPISEISNYVLMNFHASENALPSLFKRYMQVSADHARKYGGTGLGLAICKQLVEHLLTILLFFFYPVFFPAFLEVCMCFGVG